MTAEITVESSEVDANGLTFICRTAGPVDGEPVVLLHGFPETSHMWEPLMAHLAADGYRCLAPDQRGYSPKARPADQASYRYEDLVADVFALARAHGFDRFHLVGHDWGAAVGWVALATDPSPVASWTALSVAHYAAVADAVWTDDEQQPYRDLLGIMLSPHGEEVFGGDDLARLKEGAWTEATPEQVAEYVAVFSQPGAITAALNWYRASDGHRRVLDHEDHFEVGPLDTPTLTIWGNQDAYLRRTAIERAADLMTGPYRLVELDAGHWLVQERPVEVRDEVLRHLREWRMR